MSKRRLACTLILALCMCAGACTPDRDRQELAQYDSGVDIVVRGLPRSVESVVVYASPASESKRLEFNAAQSTFVGKMFLPAGQQAITARAYASDGSTLGAGSATITVLENTTSVLHLILTGSGPAPKVENTPIIGAFSISRTRIVAGEIIHVEVDAMVAAGHPLTYKWTSDCVSNPFEAATEFRTLWHGKNPGVCTLTVEVKSGSAAATESISVTVSDTGIPEQPVGTVEIDGLFVPYPKVYQFDSTCGLASRDPGLPSTGFGKCSTLGKELLINTRVLFGEQRSRDSVVVFNIYCDAQRQLTRYVADCGNKVSDCTVTTAWTPTVEGFCMIRADALNHGMSDTFITGIWVVP